jgi:hypothetical protein
MGSGGKKAGRLSAKSLSSLVGSGPTRAARANVRQSVRYAHIRQLSSNAAGGAACPSIRSGTCCAG